MKKTGAWLAVHALEQLGVKFTFGIPGVHNTEFYDELNNSKSIKPILVTHEGAGAFMADAVSRVSDSVGVLAIVPAAGVTHAASGIGEAFLDGIPMLVIAGGIRTDIDKQYQLHQIDQQAFIKGLTKTTFKLNAAKDVVPTIFEAFRIAVSGEPGPVFIELPVNLQLFPEEVGDLPAYTTPPALAAPREDLISQAAELLLAAKKPALFVGWGARESWDEVRAIADFLQAPGATTLQGLSVFPANHPLHAGFGFGAAAVPAARNAFRDCDCLLAVGTRFAEIATGSFGVNVPENLIHVDINPAVFNQNYAAKVAIEADAKMALAALLAALRARSQPRTVNTALQESIRRDKQAYLDEWLAHDNGGRVSPARFFGELRRQLADDAICVVDDGNHTYLTAELFPVHQPRCFIVPTDFNCMGYAVPAAIGAKLAQPQREVFAIVGDGAFMMTCMEIITAARLGLGIVYYVFHDGELSQIAQAQEIPYNRKPCSVLGVLNLEGVALATGASYVAMRGNGLIRSALDQARSLASEGRPVIVDINIDYSRRTAFTIGAMKTNFQRFPLAQRLRMVTRAARRKITG